MILSSDLPYYKDMSQPFIIFVNNDEYTYITSILAEYTNSLDGMSLKKVYIPKVKDFFALGQKMILNTAMSYVDNTLLLNYLKNKFDFDGTEMFISSTTLHPSYSNYCEFLERYGTLKSLEYN